jgi:hypothetical protein
LEDHVKENADSRLKLDLCDRPTSRTIMPNHMSTPTKSSQ